MQNTGWIDLFRLVPEKLHGLLMIVTADGSEIAVQDVIRLEPEYVLVRGRLSGTSDAGLAFFVPYARITFVHLCKQVPEELVYGLYGLKPPERSPAELAAAEAAAEAAGEKTPEGATPAHGINRTELLERMRSRLKKGKGGPAPAPNRKPTNNGTAAPPA